MWTVGAGLGWAGRPSGCKVEAVATRCILALPALCRPSVS